MNTPRGTRLLATLFVLSSYVPSIQPQETGKSENVLLPPSHVIIPLSPFGKTLQQTSAIISWNSPLNANSYIITLFKVENKELILHAEIRNHHENQIEFTDLEPSTEYEVVVKSVRVHLDGRMEISEDSKPYSFKTLDACEGGMVPTSCNAHCIKTCQKPRAICDKRCMTGCSCPPETPFLHNRKCIAKKDCKSVGVPVIEVIGRPTNLKIHRMKQSNDLLFTWTEVEGADFYTVLVLLRDDTVVQKIDNVKIPFLIIKGLKPRVRYRFRVQAKFRKFDNKRRDLPLGFIRPDPPSVNLITETSFYVQWSDYFDTDSYKVVIFDVDEDEVLQIFKNIKDTFLTIQGLSPGTSYDVSVIAVTSSKNEIESNEQRVKTLGVKGDKEGEEEPTEVVYVVEPTTVSTTPPPTTTPYVPTCEDRKHALEAYLVEDPKADVHVPSCDGGGNYRTRQCDKKGCYCVDRRYGKVRPGSNFESSSSKYALDCGKYGQFKIPPLDVTVIATNTKTIRVRWQKQKDAAFYIVKVFNGFQSGIVKHVSGITRPVAVVDGLLRGTAYVVTVIAVNKNGWTSTDKVKGKFFIMPHLDPPTDVKLEQIEDSRMKVSWIKNDIALHYKVEIYENGGKDPSKTYENVTGDSITFPVKSKDTYKVRVQSTGVTTIPGSGKTMLVSSNSIDVSRKATCVLPPLDVLFVLDVSTKMSPVQYKKAKQLFMDLAKSLTPISKSMKDATGSRIAAVKVYDQTRTIFRYDRFNDVSNLVGALNFVKQSRISKLSVGRMLRYVFRHFFSPVNNDDQRKNVATAVISFLGGESEGIPFSADALTLRSVTNVITVGVKGSVGDYAMSMSSPPDFRVEIPSYDHIQLAYETVMKKLCSLK